MAYLTIARLGGDPSLLLDGYRRTRALMDGVGRDYGLLMHVAARADDGLLIINLWPAADRSEAASADPRRHAALRDVGLRPEQQRKEHLDVERYVVLEREVSASA
jgi:hypothetical protein